MREMKEPFIRHYETMEAIINWYEMEREKRESRQSRVKGDGAIGSFLQEKSKNGAKLVRHKARFIKVAGIVPWR
jgi:hypothetical protein